MIELAVGIFFIVLIIAGAVCINYFEEWLKYNDKTNIYKNEEFRRLSFLRECIVYQFHKSWKETNSMTLGELEVKVGKLEQHCVDKENIWQDFINNQFQVLVKKVDCIIEKLAHPRLPLWATFIITFLTTLSGVLITLAVRK